MSNQQHKKNMEYTQACFNVTNGTGCTRPRCTFAHSIEELRYLECAFGNTCRYIDGGLRGGGKCKYRHPYESTTGYFNRLGRRFPNLPMSKTEVKNEEVRDEEVRDESEDESEDEDDSIQFILERKEERKETSHLYRTQACRNVKRRADGGYEKCTRKNCTFAHNVEELRDPPCHYGDVCRNYRCKYRHPRETRQEYYCRTNRFIPDIPLRPPQKVVLDRSPLMSDGDIYDLEKSMDNLSLSSSKIFIILTQDEYERARQQLVSK